MTGKPCLCNMAVFFCINTAVIHERFSAGSDSSNPFKFVKSDDWGRGGPLLITSVTSSFSDFHRRIWLGFVQQGFFFDSFLFREE